MKIYLYSLLLVLLLTACNKKGEAPPPRPETTYTGQAIGTRKGGIFQLSDIKSIEKRWEFMARQLLKAQKEVALEDFEIRKMKTEGETVQDCYLLVARTGDGNTRAAALLELRDDKFYFDSDRHGNYRVVLCKSECNEGCLPVVQVQDGTKNLLCSPCFDCEKSDFEAH